MQRLKKIDIHVHAVPEHGLPRSESGDTYADPEEILAIYDRIGIEKGVLLPEIGLEAAHDTTNHRETMAIVRAHPDRFAWFCNIDPRQGKNTADTDFSRFIRYYRDLGARGVGEICAHLPFDDPKMMNLFAHCEACGMPVIFHIGHAGDGDYGIVDEPGLPHLEIALKAFPRLRFIGHSHRFWSHISGDLDPADWEIYPTGKITPGGRLVTLMETYGNLCCDLSAGSGYNAMTRDPAFSWQFLETYSDRIYFGTDICSPRQATAAYLNLAAFLDEAMEAGRISYTAYERISRTNACAILEA